MAQLRTLKAMLINWESGAFLDYYLKNLFRCNLHQGLIEELMAF